MRIGLLGILQYNSAACSGNIELAFRNNWMVSLGSFSIVQRLENCVHFGLLLVLLSFVGNLWLVG